MKLHSLQTFVKDEEASVRQTLARYCLEILATLPRDSQIGVFQQMREVVAQAGCSWRIRLAMADQLGTIALLFDLQVVPSFLTMFRDFKSTCIAMAVEAA